ncbi:hypothetical protein [Gordonia terrae]|uniref:hypothetical protein n=1 Tax=Gordonia terrae TaxID=2055 RepID=UPI003F6C9F57
MTEPEPNVTPSGGTPSENAPSASTTPDTGEQTLFPIPDDSVSDTSQPPAAAAADTSSESPTPAGKKTPEKKADKAPAKKAAKKSPAGKSPAKKAPAKKAAAGVAPAKKSAAKKAPAKKAPPKSAPPPPEAPVTPATPDRPAVDVVAESDAARATFAQLRSGAPTEPPTTNLTPAYAGLAAAVAFVVFVVLRRVLR